MSRVDASYLPVRADQVGSLLLCFAHLRPPGTIPSSLLCTLPLSDTLF
jgi:hypothetical protein